MTKKRSLIIGCSLVVLFVAGCAALWLMCWMNRSHKLTPESVVTMFADAGYDVGELQAVDQYPGPLADRPSKHGGIFEVTLTDSTTVNLHVVSYFNRLDAMHVTREINALNRRMSGWFAYSCRRGSVVLSINTFDRDVAQELGRVFFDRNVTSTTLPTATPEKFLVHIPGITEPTGVFPCRNGSWDALKFGSTEEELLIRWLADSEWVDQTSLRNTWKDPSPPNTYPRVHFYAWTVLNDDSVFRKSIALDVISGTVSNLRASVFYPFTLGEVIAQLGEPESVSLYLDERYEENAYFYELYYPAQGIIVSGELFEQSICDQIRQKGGSLDAAWPVTDFDCAAPGTLLELIERTFATSPDIAKQMVEVTQPWVGFGDEYVLTP